MLNAIERYAVRTLPCNPVLNLGNAQDLMNC